MLLAISQRNDKNKHGDYMDNLENNYVAYFESFGAELLPIPNYSSNIDHYFNKFPISGIILSGGNDISPEIYGQKAREGLSVSKKRDLTEKRLLEIAVKKKLPVLGVCRGMQFINVFFKGKLIEIKEQPEANIEHIAKIHEIVITEKEAIKLLGKTLEVNSYHAQGFRIGELSSELKVFAKTQGGVIEGVYHPSLPIVGIQWHPERTSPDEEANKKLIQSFLKKELFWKK